VWTAAIIGVMTITAGITGFMALLFLRDPARGLVAATHRPELLPQVMTGRYVVIFLLALGVLIHVSVGGHPAVAAWFLAVCALMGLWDGGVYRRRGLPHARHTATGLLALGGLGIVLAGLAAGA
jgi:hypothetical protein